MLEIVAYCATKFLKNYQRLHFYNLHIPVLVETPYTVYSNEMHSENEGNSREIKTTDKCILFHNINTISQHENKDRY